MLPKDILKYARKFSPAEIESAIKTAIDAVGKTIQGVPTTYDWNTLQDIARIGVGTSTIWTTTNTITNSTVNPPFQPLSYTYSSQQ